MRVIAVFLFTVFALCFQVQANSSVLCAQTYLLFNGYNPGPLDGQMGRRSRHAAEKFVEEKSLDLPGLSAETADVWCAFAEQDLDYVAQRNFTFDGRGIVPKDVAFKALNAPIDQRARACGNFDHKISSMEALDPILRISGFNSRQDNFEEVENAREAEEFVRNFSAAAISAFSRDSAETKSKLIKLLAKWAGAGAFGKTESCVTRSGNLITSGRCAEWRKRDGSDKSSMKDATHSTFLMAALVRTYIGVLADHRPDSLKAEHDTINMWISKTFARRLKRPSSVYFGLNMGWYWPAINLDMAAGHQSQAKSKLQRVQQQIDRLVFSDGSIKDRTTRGDRALWYHYTSIGEVVMSLEMMRMADVAVRLSVEDKLHKAVDLFVRTLDDYAVIHPWAKKQRNSSYKNQTQDWNANWWPNSDFAGSWLHVYPYRYPDHPNSEVLRSKVRWDANSATADIDFGVGIGCLYNLAAGRIQ